MRGGGFRFGGGFRSRFCMVISKSLSSWSSCWSWAFPAHTKVLIFSRARDTFFRELPLLREQQEPLVPVGRAGCRGCLDLSARWDPLAPSVLGVLREQQEPLVPVGRAGCRGCLDLSALWDPPAPSDPGVSRELLEPSQKRARQVPPEHPVQWDPPAPSDLGVSRELLEPSAKLAPQALPERWDPPALAAPPARRVVQAHRGR